VSKRPPPSPENDLADLARLVASGSTHDVLLFLARLVGRYRNSNPELSRRLDESCVALRERTGVGGILRNRGSGPKAAG
jgi:hypothetical protein